MIITYNVTIRFKVIDVVRNVPYMKKSFACYNTYKDSLSYYLLFQAYKPIIHRIKKNFKSFWKKNQKENKVYRKTISCPIRSSSKVFGGSL